MPFGVAACDVISLQVTLETFLAWKKRKKAEKLKAMKSKKDKRKKDFKSGNLRGVSSHVTDLVALHR